MFFGVFFSLVGLCFVLVVFVWLYGIGFFGKED